MELVFWIIYNFSSTVSQLLGMLLTVVFSFFMLCDICLLWPSVYFSESCLVSPSILRKWQFHKVEVKSDDMMFSCIVLYVILPLWVRSCHYACIFVKRWRFVFCSDGSVSHVSIKRNIPKLWSRDNCVELSCWKILQN
jgi:hypothetical protein